MSRQVEVCVVPFAISAYTENGTIAVFAVGVVHNLLS
jgi:hypothetical protein